MIPKIESDTPMSVLNTVTLVLEQLFFSCYMKAHPIRQC